MLTATRDQFQRAIDKSQTLGTHRMVTALGNDRYSVLGSDGNTFYRVTVLRGGDDFRCDCKAGMAERACYHCGGVWTYRLGEQMKAAAVVMPIAEPLPEFLLSDDGLILQPEPDGRYGVVGILIEGTPAHSAGCELFGPGVPNCPRCN